MTQLESTASKLVSQLFGWRQKNTDGTPGTTTGKTYCRDDFSQKTNAMIDGLSSLHEAIVVAQSGENKLSRSVVANAHDWWAENRRRKMTGAL